MDLPRLDRHRIRRCVPCLSTYETDPDENGEILLIDEVHTSDSNHY